MEQEERILATIGLEDFFGEVTGAYLAYQEALIVFDRVGTAGLRTAMNGLLERLGYLDIPELRTLAGTLDRWMPEIWAYFETGTTNAAPRAVTARSNRSSGLPAASGTTTTTHSA